MERELKFRAWQPSQKKMHMEVGLHPFIMTNHTMCDEDESGYVAEGTGKGEYTLFANQSEWPIMQFTGLVDRHSKEIYEGDICQIRYYDEGFKNGQVVFRILFSGYYLEGDFGQYSMSTWEPSFIEVIGNIHENPELLCL